MRKRTITHSAKTIFWWLIYLMPVICYVVFSYGVARANGGFADTFGTYMSENYDLMTNDIYYALSSIFFYQGDSILPIFGHSDGILIYMTYFIGVNLVHLFVDFILFIPRLCHKWLNTFTRSEDCE